MITIAGREENKVPDLIVNLVLGEEERGTYARGTADELRAAAEELKNENDAYADWQEAAEEISAMLILQAMYNSNRGASTGGSPVTGQSGAHSALPISHTTTMPSARDLMDISSEIGTKRAVPALEFGEELTRNKQPLENVKLVMKNLGTEASAFFQFIENDPLTSIEFELGDTPNADGETFLYAHIGEWVNLEDPAAPIFVNWHEINRSTKLKIRMILKPSSIPAQVYSRAVHELTVHGVFYKKFIEFIRSASNRYSEVALYYYRHINYDKELSGYTQHYQHGNSPDGSSSLSGVSRMRSRGAPESLSPASGIPAYNETILNLIKATWSTDQSLAKAIKKEAEGDVTRHTRQFPTQEPTVKKTSYQKQDVDFFAAIPPREGSPSQLFAHLLDKKSPGKKNTKLDSVLESLTPVWVKLLLSYFDYKEKIGEAFLFDRSALTDLSATGDGTTISIWSQEPLAETRLEAIAEFLAYGWQSGDRLMSDRWGFVHSLLLEIADEEWEVIETYIAFRQLYYIATGKADKAEIWRPTGEDIPRRVNALKG